MSRTAARQQSQESDSDFDPNDDFDESAVNDIIKEAPASSSRSSARVNQISNKANGRDSRLASVDTTSKPRFSRGRAAAHDQGSNTTELTNGNTASIAPFIGPAHPPDILCAFCQGTANYNFKSRRPEMLVSCVECGSSGHPTCMKWGRNGRKAAIALNYQWRCMDCKTCEVCCTKDNEAKIMFCDRCDRGWHLYCLKPALDKIPKGSWNCPTCILLEGHVNKQLQSQQSSSSKSKKGPRMSSHAPSVASPLASVFGSWEAGANFGSVALEGKANETTSPYKGPMKASAPYPSDFVNGISAMSGVGRRVRKPTDLDRSYEFSRSPIESQSHSPSTTNHSRSNSSVGNRLEERKGKGKANQGLSHSIIVRLKRNSNNDSPKRPNGQSRNAVRKARPKSMRLLDVDLEEESEAESSSSSPPTPRALSVSEEEQDEEESDEEQAFGGILSEADADTSKTVPTSEDKERFEQSKLSAETKLGGVISSLPGSLSGRIIKKPGAASLDNVVNSVGKIAASGYFTGSPWAGTGTGGEKAHRKAKGAPSSSQIASSQIVSSQSIDVPTSTPPTPAIETSTATSAESGKAMPIKMIRFGGFDIDTWFQAPYPEEYSLVPDGRLWICEHCLKYMKSRFMATRHRLKCKMRHPPGAEIYRDGNVSVFEVDGRKNKIYCQNLCLLAKMFLDHKTLYYDVEPFLFYVVAEVDDLGAHFVGYFSKEKRSPLNYNVSCIMTLPIRQRRGWGNFIIDISYLLSKKEGRLGSPEKPLSDLGLLSYRNYWTLAVFHYLQTASDHVSLQNISNATSMTLEDVFYVLRDQDMITVSDGQSGRSRAPATSKYKSREGAVSQSGSSNGLIRPRRAQSSTTVEKDKEGALAIPSVYSIHIDRDFINAHLKNYEAKDYLKVRPEMLHWTPFLVVRTLTQADMQIHGEEANQTMHPPPLFSMAPTDDQDPTQATEEANRVAASLSTINSKAGLPVNDAEGESPVAISNGISIETGEEPTTPPDHVLLFEPGQPKVIVPAPMEVETISQVEDDMQKPLEQQEQQQYIDLTRSPTIKPRGEKRLTSPTSATSTPNKRSRRNPEKGRSGNTRGMQPIVEISTKMPLSSRRSIPQESNKIYYHLDDGSDYTDDDALGSDDPMVDM